MAQNVDGSAPHPMEQAVLGKLVMGEAASRFAGVLPLQRPAEDPLAPMRASREAERSAARAQVERSPEIAKLRGRGEDLKVLGQQYAEARATVHRDPRLSEVGKAERGAALHEEFSVGLERLGRAYAGDEQALRDRFSGKGETWRTSAGARKAEDAARVASLAAVVPLWPASRALELVRQAAAEGDRVVLQEVWPIVERLVESDPRARGELEALRPDVELALGDAATFGRDAAREIAADLRQRFHGLAMQVARNGGWDRAFDPMLAGIVGAEPPAA